MIVVFIFAIGFYFIIWLPVILPLIESFAAYDKFLDKHGTLKDLLKNKNL